MSSDLPSSKAAPLRVAIAGLGVVGSEVARQLTHRAADLQAPAPRGFDIVAVSARSRDTDRGFGMDGIDWHDNAAEPASRDDVDIIVEMIGGHEGVALDLVRTALTRGIHVVTANKALLAHHGTELARLAETHGAALLFEAAIAGGIPAVKALREGLAGNRFSRVSGILNGTCNYILTRMERTGEAFDDVLADAQALGYAEAEPSLDVDGIDAAHKLTLLAAIAFGQTPDFDKVSIAGIRDVSAVDFGKHFGQPFTAHLVCCHHKGHHIFWRTPLLQQGFNGHAVGLQDGGYISQNTGAIDNHQTYIERRVGTAAIFHRTAIGQLVQRLAECWRYTVVGNIDEISQHSR